MKFRHTLSEQFSSHSDPKPPEAHQSEHNSDVSHHRSLITCENNNKYCDISLKHAVPMLWRLNFTDLSSAASLLTILLDCGGRWIHKTAINNTKLINLKTCTEKYIFCECQLQNSHFQC